MNTPSAPQPERPPADGTSGSADEDIPVTPDQSEDDVPRTPDQSESALRPAGGLTGTPDQHQGSGPGGDDKYDDDEYEPL